MNTSKLRRPFLLAAAAAATFIVGACTTPEAPKPPTPTASPAATQSPTTSPEVANPGEAAVQKLVGKWDGVEGTYLSVTEKMGADGKQQLPRKFEVEIKDLDRAEKFEGTAKNGVIEFTRKGKTETVKAATGAETGMKYLEKESNCVVVTKGSEGFCKKADASASRLLRQRRPPHRLPLRRQHHPRNNLRITKDRTGRSSFPFFCLTKNDAGSRASCVAFFRS